MKEMSQHPDYVYDPLPESRIRESTGTFHFRLLRLLPGYDHEPVCIELQNCCSIIDTDENTANSQAPEYEAVSYCWASMGSIRFIQCHQKLFKISHTVFEALQSLRHATDARMLWIDSICINQDNPLEKAHQVRGMRFIYSCAASTLVWLGPSTTTTELAFAAVSRLVDVRARLDAANINYKRIPDGSKILNDNALPSRAEKDPALQALLEILELAWFERI